MSNTVTEKDVLDSIKNVHTIKMGLKTTVVVMTLENGFEVVGTSSCVDPENYDHEVGVEYATKKCHDKIWELLGFSLQQNLFIQEELERA